MITALWHRLFNSPCDCELADMKVRRERAIKANSGTSGRVFTAALDHIERSNAATDTINEMLASMDRTKNDRAR